MPASFNGVAIFGTSVRMSHSYHPRSRQENAYFGLSGLEYIDGGLRGGYTMVTGVLSGIGAAGFNSALQSFANFEDGNVYTLVDTTGNQWANVYLDWFRPHGKIKQSPAGILFREYEAKFNHLS